MFLSVHVCSSISTCVHVESDAIQGLNVCDLQGRLLRELQSFVYAGQPGYLPSFAQRAKDFQESVYTLVYDVLMLKVSPQKALQAYVITALVLMTSYP